MNIPEWALGSLLVFSSLLFAQETDSVLQSTSPGTAGLLKINLPGCPQLSDTDSVYSYTGNSDGCEWFGIAARQPDIKIVVQEPLLSSEGDLLLVSGHYLDIDSTRQTYPQLTGKSLNTSVLANTDSQLPAVKVISPVLEVYGSRESMFLLYEEHEEPVWQWVRVNATQPEGMMESERRFSLDEGESLHLSSCGFDLAVQSEALAQAGNKAVITVSEQNGQVLVHEWDAEPQDMDGGGGGSGGAIDWWGGDTAADLSSGETPRRASQRLKPDKSKDDDEDPEDKKVKPKILSQCEASAVTVIDEKLTINELKKQLRSAAEVGRMNEILRTALAKYESSKARKGSAISPRTVKGFVEILSDRGFISKVDRRIVARINSL